MAKLVIGMLLCTSAAVLLVAAAVCPDGSECPAGQPCCSMANQTENNFGCCPYQDGVCCKDKKTCCPKGRACFLHLCFPIGKHPEDSSDDFSSTSAPKDLYEPLVTLTKVQDQPCGQGSCPDGTTCCFNIGCCPFDNAVCCSDRQHCCPSGMTCSVSEGLCTQSTSSEVGQDGAFYSKFLARGNESCPRDSTQCGNSGCCPISHGVCCSDNQHCCPEGHECDLANNLCRRNTNTLEVIEQPDNIFKEKFIACPDGNYCDDNNTCCLLASGVYGCCPYPLAVCCSDKAHCCPQNTRCDSTFQHCLSKKAVLKSKVKTASFSLV